jgi:hypothetical protein
MPLFTTLTPQRIADEISNAAQRVVLACAGIQKPVADALLAAHARLPGAVKVVLDVAPGVARLGYGDFECIQHLFDAGVDVRHQSGLRIGVLICDAHGLAFASAVRLVEADPTTDVDAFNAIALTEAQILQLCAELPSTRTTDDASPSRVDAPLVGEQKVDAARLERTDQNLKLAPPQPFDLARQANMYSALVQFVELKLQGFKFESRRITLPKSLPMIASQNKEVKARLSASFKFLEESVPQEITVIGRELEALRKAYLIPVGPAGRIILKSKRKAFETELRAISDELDKSRETLTRALDAKIKEVIDALVPELARAVLADPPPRFRGLYQVDEDGAKEFVTRELKSRLPDAQGLTAQMKILCLFKDVTYEMLKARDFCERVVAALPASVLESGLLNEQVVVEAGHPALRQAKDDAGT